MIRALIYKQHFTDIALLLTVLKGVWFHFKDFLNFIFTFILLIQWTETRNVGKRAVDLQQKYQICDLKAFVAT